jgi:hypothetical protein
MVLLAEEFCPLIHGAHFFHDIPADIFQVQIRVMFRNSYIFFKLHFYIDYDIIKIQLQDIFVRSLVMGDKISKR